MTFQESGGWQHVFSRLFSREDLTEHEARLALSEVFLGDATPVQIAAFLASLRTKGETVEELTGLVAAMRDHCVPVDLEDRRELAVDTCGTGGDRSGTINISTLSAFVVAGAGVPVLKHGNRAASSQTGTADVLEELGAQLELSPERVRDCVVDANFGFCFAPRFHPAMRQVGPVRTELGVPTVFNILGPLVNPGHVRRQVVGVADRSKAERMLGVLESAGAHHTMVVFGHDGLDELSTTTTSTILESAIGADAIRVRREYDIDPTEYGIERAEPEMLRGGDRIHNAARVRAILDGEPGPQRDIVVLNAAAGLQVGGVASNFEEGIELARSAIDTGRAKLALQQFVTISNRPEAR